MFFVHCHCSLSFGVMASVFGWAREMTSATHLLFSLFDCVELWFVLVVFLDVTHTKFLLANCMGPCHQQTCKYAGGSNSQQNAVVMYWLSYRGLLFFSFGNVGAGVGGLVCVCIRQACSLSVQDCSIDDCELLKNMYQSFLQHQLREAKQHVNTFLTTSRGRGAGRS